MVYQSRDKFISDNYFANSMHSLKVQNRGLLRSIEH